MIFARAAVWPSCGFFKVIAMSIISTFACEVFIHAFDFNKLLKTAHPATRGSRFTRKCLVEMFKGKVGSMSCPWLSMSPLASGLKVASLTKSNRFGVWSSSLLEVHRTINWAMHICCRPWRNRTGSRWGFVWHALEKVLMILIRFMCSNVYIACKKYAWMTV